MGQSHFLGVPKLNKAVFVPKSQSVFFKFNVIPLIIFVKDGITTAMND